jgi:hypothetical protein
MNPHPFRIARAVSLLTVSALLLTGCEIFGIAAQALPEGQIPARYTGLQGHTVAVMVWAPRGLEIDYPALRLDVASQVQDKLLKAQKAGKGELKGATFPHIPASVVRFQEDHPELEGHPIDQVAPRLRVQRLIYIELENFQTRAQDAIELFRGQATASLKVVDVTSGGQAKVVYDEPGITVLFPPKAPAEGYPGLGDAKTYQGTVELFTTALARRFYPYDRK